MTDSVIDVLQEQHRRLAELFERVSSPEEDRPGILHLILKELAAHVAAERSAVRPVVEREELGEGLADQLEDDYERMEKLMVLIERRKFNSPDVPDLVSELKAVVEEHDERSRRELFPGLAARLTAEEQAELGEKVAGEDAIVISHPHPHLLSLGPVANLMTRVAQKWDSARDRTATNRQHEEDDSKRHVSRLAAAWHGARSGRGGDGSDGAGPAGAAEEPQGKDVNMGGA